MNFAHRADGIGVDPFFGQAQALAGMAGLAHLGDDTRLARDAAHQPGFLNGVRERFLAVNVEPE